MVVTTPSGLLQQERTTRAVGDFSHPFMGVLQLLAQAPAIESLRFPVVWMGHNHQDPETPRTVAEMLPDRFADEGAEMLRDHGKLTALEMGGVKYTRSSLEPRGRAFQRLPGASNPRTHADERA
jgi:hypothetical protein